MKASQAIKRAILVIVATVLLYVLGAGPVYVNERIASHPVMLKLYGPYSTVTNSYFPELGRLMMPYYDFWYRLFHSHWPIRGNAASTSIRGSSIFIPPRNFPSIEELMEQRAQSILIPRVELDKVTLAEALDFLRRESRTIDPRHEGIEVYDPEPWHAWAGHSKGDTPPAGGWPLYYPLEQRVSASLHDVSLLNALKIVARQADCSPHPTRTGLALVPAPFLREPKFTETIPLAHAYQADVARIRTDPKAYLQGAGIYLDPDGSCSFEADGTTLVLFATLPEIYAVRELLEGDVRLGQSK